MSFRDFTPRGRPQGGLEFEDGNVGGSNSNFSPRNPNMRNNNKKSPLRRTTSANNANNISSTSTPNNSNTPQPMRHLDSLQYSRSQSDSTYQMSPFKSYNDDITPQNNNNSILIQQREDEYALQVMQQREEEMKDIHRKMHVVNEIYKDLGNVVESQQDQINSVEDKFGNAAESTRRGLEQIEKANTVKSRRWGRGRGGGSNTGGDEDGQNNDDNGGGGGMGEKRKQYAVFHYLSKSANEIVKLVSVCGGSGSAGYVDESSWKK